MCAVDKGSIILPEFWFEIYQLRYLESNIERSVRNSFFKEEN